MCIKRQNYVQGVYMKVLYTFDLGKTTQEAYDAK